MIKLILISFILFTATWFLVNRSKAQARAGMRIVVIMFTIFAIVTILIPETSNNVANAVGVGRGADLILYILTALFVFFVLAYYIRTHEEQRRIVVLARKLALIDANIENKDRKIPRKNKQK